MMLVDLSSLLSVMKSGSDNIDLNFCLNLPEMRSMKASSLLTPIFHLDPQL